MAILRKIKDGDTTIYPMTSTLNVFTEDGQNLDDLLFKSANIQPITFTTYSYSGTGDDYSYHWKTNVPITTDPDTYWDINFSNQTQLTNFINLMEDLGGALVDITIGTTNVHYSTGDLFPSRLHVAFTNLQTGNYYLYYNPNAFGSSRGEFDTILKDSVQTKKSLQTQIDDIYAILDKIST